jgi:protein-L-isoaspartate(D-aspartate) O-methyltransferase
VDVIFVNAGITHPREVWLDRLRPGGRLLLPLTFATGSGAGKGATILVTREQNGYSARCCGFVMIYSCSSVRDLGLNQAILKLISGGSVFKVRSLRQDQHAAEESCLLHGESFCLSGADLRAR